MHQCCSHCGKQGPPLVDADWHVFSHAISKGMEGSELAELCFHYREMNKAAGAKKPKKPSERQTATALWTMKAAWDRGEEHHDPARTEDILGRTITRLDLWEEHLKDPIAAQPKRWNAWKIPCKIGIWFHSVLLPASCRRNGLQHRWC